MIVRSAFETGAGARNDRDGGSTVVDCDVADVLRTLGQIEIRRGRYEAALSYLPDC